MPLNRHSQSLEVLGGTANIGMIIDDSLVADELFRNVWQQAIRFERQFSRFLPSSELSQFNAQSGIKVPVSPEFADILHAAKHFTKKTAGLFNPFVLPALQRAGYKTSAVTEYVGDSSPDYSARTVVSSSKLELGDDWARIPHGTAVDLGGCGKGYLADQLGSYLRSQSVAGYWIELSGDIATYGTDETGQCLTIAVKNANVPGNLTEVIACPLTPFGIATSGTFPRISQVDTLKGHHIIDPQTGKPAVTDLKLATVCASSAIEADVFASCAIIVGSENAPAVLQGYGVTSWILQSAEKVTTHGRNIQKPLKEVEHA